MDLRPPGFQAIDLMYSGDTSRCFRNRLISLYSEYRQELINVKINENIYYFSYLFNRSKFKKEHGGNRPITYVVALLKPLQYFLSISHIYFAFRLMDDDDENRLVLDKHATREVLAALANILKQTAEEQ